MWALAPVAMEAAGASVLGSATGAPERASAMARVRETASGTESTAWETAVWVSALGSGSPLASVETATEVWALGSAMASGLVD